MASDMNVKNIFEKYLLALYEDLKHKNQMEKTRIQEIMKSNAELSSQLETSYPQTSKSLIPITSIFTVSQKLTQASLQICDKNLNEKMQKIRNYTEAIEQRVKEESQRLRETFNGIFYMKDVSIMPFYDVEAVREELEEQIQILSQQFEKQRANSKQILNNLHNHYGAVMKDVGNVEKVEEEMRINISQWLKIINDKFSDMEIEPTAEFYFFTQQEEMLRNEISQLKEELNE